MWFNLNQNQFAMQNQTINVGRPVSYDNSQSSYNTSKNYSVMNTNTLPELNYQIGDNYTTNIYNNYFGSNSNLQTQPTAPLIQGQLIGGGYPATQQSTMPMFQGQMFGSSFPMTQQSTMPMFQGQMFGSSFPMTQQSTMPMLQGQMFGSGNNSITDYLSNFWNNLLSQISQYNLNSPYSESITIEDDLKGAWGDPHFNFKDKTGENVTVDHKGTDGETYNVLNADGLDIDAEYKKWTQDNPQVMGAIRVKAGEQELVLNEGKATLDGKEIEAGKIQLSDGRIVDIQDNGNVTINTKDGNGSINLVNNDGYYDIDPTGKLNIDIGKDAGGVLGFLTKQGQTKDREEIMQQFDTDKSGLLDNGDTALNKIFKTQNDIGLYQY